MDSHKEWCDEKVSRLSNEDTRVPALQEMKDFFSSIPRDEMTRTANSLQLPLIFDCLNDSNNEQIDLACEVLSICMNNLSLGESTNRYGTFLERALNHPNSGVKIMALSEIKRNIKDEDVLVSLCKRESLVFGVIRCMADDDISVGKEASEIITHIGISSLGLKQLVKENAIKELYEVMKVNEIVRLRVYEALIKIAVESEDNLNMLKGAGLFSKILSEIDNNDVLLKLNILELLSQLGQCDHGFSYLEENHVLKKITGMFKNNDVFLELCEPGILKFFGSMAHLKPLEVLSTHPKLYQRMFDNLQSPDQTFIVFGVSVETLGHIGITNGGKIALDSTGPSIENAIKTISKEAPSYPTEVKIRVLNCLANLIRVVDHNNQVTTITHKWFSLIDEDPMDYIWKFSKNPFGDLRIAGFGVLGALSGQIWGQEAIRNTAGLVEFLLDRSVEHVKECKEAKYSIIEQLANSSVFDSMTVKRLQTYVREGPFYVQPLVEVAIEGDE